MRENQINKCYKIQAINFCNMNTYHSLLISTGTLFVKNHQKMPDQNDQISVTTGNVAMYHYIKLL